ncbi:MerR family transcriptional regulator [Nocardia stercoris]|uniref:MerR family transcriptional regulator n=1 Tax=Nocardia stercoris TaxID=2483361 RepID=A0A3M2L6W4_9NOCA|nr:MerR family transcriptional regulator [Nocardia stercoris]RMI32283.1 MerR family transcriptional regulator [Nocardia stercoris]
MITIGQLAGYVGVTIKAVRVYHDKGLLAEPERDASGYRRYTARDAIDLIKIKTLAQAGVPLARIKELLAADPDEFSAALGDVDAALRAKAAEIRRTRARIAQLRSGDRLFVTEDVADYLDALRELGIGKRTIEMERDGWILMQATNPDDAATWIADKLDALRDPEFVALYREFDAAFDWAPDDPRLAELAERSQRWMEQREQAERAETPSDPGAAQLAAESAEQLSPAWDELTSLARRRSRRGRSGN